MRACQRRQVRFKPPHKSQKNKTDFMKDMNESRGGAMLDYGGFFLF